MFPRMFVGPFLRRLSVNLAASQTSGRRLGGLLDSLAASCTPRRPGRAITALSVGRPGGNQEGNWSQSAAWASPARAGRPRECSGGPSVSFYNPRAATELP